MATPRAKNVSKNGPRFTAEVKTLAQVSITNKDEVSNRGREIMARIKKCLALANHRNSPVAEAEAALRMASRLMTQHNITHNDIVGDKGMDEDYSQQAGQSTVSISSAKLDKRVVKESWVGIVASAMTKFYDCKCYSTERMISYEWTFYGIAPNTVAAAMSFEMVYNLIWNWSLGRGRAQFSYQHGVAAGLRRIAKEEQKAESVRAKKKEKDDAQAQADAEQAQRQRELDRLEPSLQTDSNTDLNTTTGVAAQHLGFEADLFGHWRDVDDTNTIKYDDDDGDDNELFDFEPQATFKEEDEQDIDIKADFEVELKKHVSSMPVKLDPYADQSSSRDLSNTELEDQNLELVCWSSHSALVVFRQTAEKVADDFLAAQNQKLSKGRASNFKIRDREAYDEGKEDSKTIDLKRRRIEN